MPGFRGVDAFQHFHGAIGSQAVALQGKRACFFANVFQSPLSFEPGVRRKGTLQRWVNSFADFEKFAIGLIAYFELIITELRHQFIEINQNQHIR